MDWGNLRATVRRCPGNWIRNMCRRQSFVVGGGRGIGGLVGKETDKRKPEVWLGPCPSG